jgi:hypothetical protein
VEPVVKLAGSEVNIVMEDKSGEVLVVDEQEVVTNGKEPNKTITRQQTIKHRYFLFILIFVYS